MSMTWRDSNTQSQQATGSRSSLLDRSANGIGTNILQTLKYLLQIHNRIKFI
jgi:hypothetical protein